MNDGQQPDRQQLAVRDMSAFLSKQLHGEIKRALPAHLTVDRMVRIGLTAIRTTPQLAECTQISFAACMLQASQLGLEVNTPLGQAYLIPRRNNKLQGKPMEATLQIGYKGFIEIARRGGVSIHSYIVREGDLFKYELGLNPDLKHVPSELADRAERKITHAYAVARSQHLVPIFEVLDESEIEARKRLAGTEKFWGPYKAQMSRKAAVRALFNWIPKSAEMAVAQAVDITNRPQLQDITPSAAEFHSKLLNAGQPDYAQDDGAAEDEEPEVKPSKVRALAAAINAPSNDPEREKLHEPPENE